MHGLQNLTTPWSRPLFWGRGGSETKTFQTPNKAQSRPFNVKLHYSHLDLDRCRRLDHLMFLSIFGQAKTLVFDGAKAAKAEQRLPCWSIPSSSPSSPTRMFGGPLCSDGSTLVRFWVFLEPWTRELEWLGIISQLQLRLLQDFELLISVEGTRTCMVQAALQMSGARESRLCVLHV